VLHFELILVQELELQLVVLELQLVVLELHLVVLELLDSDFLLVHQQLVLELLVCFHSLLSFFPLYFSSAFTMYKQVMI
jgi:hypothetical protein